MPVSLGGLSVGSLAFRHYSLLIKWLWTPRKMRPYGGNLLSVSMVTPPMV